MDKLEKIGIGLLVLAFVVVGFNFIQTTKLLSEKKGGATVLEVPRGATPAEQTQQLLPVVSDIIPKGVPKIYGSELGVSFDDISADNPQSTQATIAKIATFDNGITLSASELTRYIATAGQISCEYCCGAPAIIFSNGKAACGCQHSAVMRGLAKYLLQKHASEYTDDQILEELGKWKTMFFPGPIEQKAAVLKQKGIELNYINLASNKYRGIEKGAPQGGSSGSGMVGGC
jgi:hypothetical protein